MKRRIALLGSLVLLAVPLARAQLFDESDDPDMRTVEAIFPDAFRHPTKDFIAAEGQNAADALQQIQQGTQQANQGLAEARRQFWASYPNGPTHAADAAKLSKLLFAKDFYYLTLEFMPQADRPGMNLLTGGSIQVDNNTPTSANAEWFDWIHSIKDRLDREHINLVDLAPKILEAIADSAPHYARYVIARDWAEFDTVNVKISPRQYALMLVQRWPKAKPDADTLEDYRAMSSVFGKDRMDETAAQVQEAATNRSTWSCDIPAGSLDKLGLFYSEDGQEDAPAPPGKIAIDGSGQSVSRFPVWLELLGQGGGRGYLVLRLVEDQLMRPIADTSRYPWAAAIAEADNLTASYGQTAVMAAVEKVKNAQQSQMPGYVIGRDLGLPPSTSGTAIRRLLARDDPDGFARQVIAEHNAKSPVSTADFTALETTHGKDSMLAAAKTIAQALLSGQPYTGLGAQNDDAYEALIACLTPHQANNPYYVAWSKWPVGSRAIYHHLWREHNGIRTMDNTEIALVLAAVSPQSVTLIRTERELGHAYVQSTSIQIGAWQQPDAGGKVQTKVHPTEDLYSDKSYEESAPGPAVTLHLAGKDLVCQQRIDHTRVNGDLQLFTSDDVPGMLAEIVQRKNVTYDSCNDERLISFQPGDGTAPTGQFTEWPAVEGLPGGAVSTASNAAPPQQPVPVQAPVLQTRSISPEVAPVVPTSPEASTIHTPMAPTPPPIPAPARNTALAEPVSSASPSPPEAILAIVNKSSHFTGITPQPGFGNWQTEAELDWDAASQTMKGWIYLPQLMAKKRWEGKIVSGSGKTFLEMKETAMIYKGPGSSALLGVTYLLSPVRGELQGVWMDGNYKGTIQLSPCK